MDGYCRACSWARCDTSYSTCPMKGAAIKVTEMEHRDNIPWWNAKLGPQIFHRCRWQTRAWVNQIEPVERCACGAFGPAPFMRIDPYPSRESRKQRSGKPYDVLEV